MRHGRAALVAAAAALVVGLPAGPAAAQEPDFVVPDGQGCEGFDLLGYAEPGRRQTRSFTNADGDIVRVMETGTGGPLTLENGNTGESLTLRSNGANQVSVITENGSTNVFTGHWVLIFFPTDVPAGPSTTLVVGRAVVEIVIQTDPDGETTETWELQSLRGRTVDICAALS